MCGREATNFALAGLAAHNGLLVCSLRGQKELLFIDAKAGKVLGKRAVDDPRGLAFDSKGRLLVLAGRQLLGLSGEQGAGSGEYATSLLRAPRSLLIADGLEDPQQLALDSKGNYYISDHGKSHQVKVFDPLGKPLRSIGHAGPPRAGRYDPRHMNDPNGLTIDSIGRLWVAETNFQPKRVSVWALDGQLLGGFYGPSEYGGGGTLDPIDKTRFYYHGMEFRLDWKAGSDQLARVLFRSDADDVDVPKKEFVNGQPETPIYVESSPGRKQRYFTNCYTSNPTNGASIATLWIDRGNAARAGRVDRPSERLGLAQGGPIQAALARRRGGAQRQFLRTAAVRLDGRKRRQAGTARRGDVRQSGRRRIHRYARSFGGGLLG